MKKLLLLAALLGLTLCGCARWPDPAPEFTLQDVPVGVTLPKPYAMYLPQTENLVEVARTGQNACWESADGSCSVVTAVTDTDRETALRQLTGFDPSRLYPVEDSCWGMPRWRFSWTTRTEEGTYLCQGQILTDEHWCYCLAVSCREDADGFTRALCSQVMAGFGLYQEEDA